MLRAFTPNDGLLGNHEIAERTELPKPTVSRLTYTLTKLGYLTHVERFEKYQLAPAAHRARLYGACQYPHPPLCPHPHAGSRATTGGAVAVGTRDRLNLIYFGSRAVQARRELDVGSRIPIATTAMGRAYVGRCRRRARGCATARAEASPGQR